MKKSKRLSLVLAMVMALSLLAGCGGNDSGKDAPGGSAPPAQTGKDSPAGGVDSECVSWRRPTLSSRTRSTPS